MMMTELEAEHSIQCMTHTRHSNRLCALYDPVTLTF